ncbi:hypothetical protein BFJ69_g8635 [Fusarium oxysporum]|uniref:Uncharacterized protein n=1 Tax=Fusarium oxysporum TaxID=5507 RepID=A0A420N1P4_FUSOX|nr:hypothetical protein BFJ69_g8635 [Fusarium oxysporum]
MSGTTQENIDPVGSPEKTHLVPRVAANQRDDHNLCFLSLEIVDRCQPHGAAQRPLSHWILIRGVFFAFAFLVRILRIFTLDGYLNLSTKSMRQCTKLASIWGQQSDILRFVFALSN